MTDERDCVPFGPFFIVMLVAMFMGYMVGRSHGADRTERATAKLDSSWEAKYVELANKWGDCRARIVMDSLYYSGRDYTDTITVTSIKEDPR